MRPRAPFDDLFLDWLRNREALRGADVTARISCTTLPQSICLTLVDGRLESIENLRAPDVEISAADEDWLEMWAMGGVDIVSEACGIEWSGHPLALAILVGCLPNPLAGDIPLPKH